MATIRLEADEEGVRIDVFLARKLPELSRSAVQKLVENGCVTSGGKAVRKNHKVSPGERIDADIPEPAPISAVPQDLTLEIAYEDGDVIVVNKPRGMVVHPAPGHADGTLVNALLHHCRGSLSGIGGALRPGIVHRIDKDTSGLVIAAKNDAAHASLSAQLKNRSLSRIYEAVVVGTIKNESGTVDAPIGRHPTDRKRQAIGVKNARSAVTHYEVLARYPGYTHVRCRLETGRTHQIRVHMASIGHPVLGDMIYGRKKAEKGLEGQCLHARELKFIHPRTGEQIVIKTDLPPYFVKILGKLGNTL